MLDRFDAHDAEVLARLAELGENQRELLAAAHAILTALDPENKERERASKGAIRWRPETAALRHIHDTLLEKIEPAQRWGDLRAVRTKSGQVLWLCAQHAAVQQPPEQKL